MASNDYYAPSGGLGAAGAIEAFLQQRAEEERKQRAEERQRQLDAQAEAQRQAENQRASALLTLQQQEYADRKTREARQDQIANAKIAVDESTPGVISSNVAGMIRGTPYESRLSTQTTLPSRSMAGDPTIGMVSQDNAGGQSFDVLNPTQAQEVAQGQRAARGDLVSALRKGGHAEAAAYIPAGLTPPAELLKDPDADMAKAVALENLRGQWGVKQAQVRAATSGAGGGIDYEAVADAIMSGDQPPTINTRSHDGMRVQSILAKKGYKLAEAMTDWAATQQHFKTLNGAQQTRLRQAASTAYESLNVIDELSAQWKGGRLPVLNKANLAAAKAGVYGKDAASVATQLEAQIADLTSELANVYMGGNSPTDAALKLAGHNLSADWDQKVLGDMTALARKNLAYRLNSIRQVGAITSSSGAVIPDITPATSHDAGGGDWKDLGGGIKVRVKPGQ